MFREAFRVLEPGGRLAVSDIVETAAMPAALRGDPGALIACVAGAASVETIRALLRAAGFDEVHVDVSPASGDFIREWVPGAERYVAAAAISASKPNRR